MYPNRLNMGYYIDVQIPFDNVMSFAKRMARLAG